MGRHGFDTEFLGYDLTEKITQEDVDEALVLLNNVCAPCPPDIAVKAATALRLRTKARREHVDDLKMMVALFAEDLSQYPADVVVDACKSWGTTNIFFPSWAELKELLDRRVRVRRAMQSAIIANRV